MTIRSLQDMGKDGVIIFVEGAPESTFTTVPLASSGCYPRRVYSQPRRG